ncbi:ATP-binding cassette domain-containing protein [Verrucomicrobiota bacterium]
MLKIEGLEIHFGADDPVRAVDGISLEIAHGEIVALVGESGSGKSISALSITRLTPKAARYHGGRILFHDQDLLAMAEPELRKIRGNRISYIFQEPSVSLNPVFTVGWQIGEAIRLHRKGVKVKDEVKRLLGLVQLPERIAQAYPHQMSGGQQQRVMIAMALACEPDLLVADEPTTALDVTVQKEILSLLLKLREECGLSILLITHNFGIVNGIADRVYVMNNGKIVEEGETRQVLHAPQHAYTQRLMAAIPRLRPQTGEAE